jgi:chromosome segregation ATPase
MKIFNNNKTKNEANGNISLSDYERKLEERKEEYEHLNEILRGMRAEVSNLMEEIKDVTDNLVKKNAELFLLEQSIDDLKRSYELLQQNVKYEEEAFNKVNNELTKIKNEINESLPHYNKLISAKNEYETLSKQLMDCKAELEKTNNQTKLLEEVSENVEHKNKLDIPMATKKQKCQAKTKTGSKCKRYAVEGSFYCASHSSIVSQLN